MNHLSVNQLENLRGGRTTPPPTWGPSPQPIPTRPGRIYCLKLNPFQLIPLNSGVSTVMKAGFSLVGQLDCDEIVGTNG